MNQKFTGKRKHLSMQFGLFLGYLIITSTTLILFAVFISFYVSKILINNEMTKLDSLNNSFESQIDQVLENIDSTSANINYSNLMADTLDSSYNLNIGEHTPSGLVDLFMTINGTDIKADQINLYDLRGKVIETGMLTLISSANNKDLDWLNEVLSRKGVKYISTPYETAKYGKSIHSKEWFISLYRTCTNHYGHTIGAIETIKRCKTIFKSVNSYSQITENPASTYIFNKEGKMVYPYNISIKRYKSDLYYLDAISSLNNKSSKKNPTTGNVEHFVYLQSTYSGWTYITVQKENVILAPVKKLHQLLSVSVLLLSIICMVISYELSKSMVVPIKHLKHRIQRLEINTLGQEKADHYNPSYVELSDLYTAFEHMSDKLQISMIELINTRQQEVRSRTLALQSQTNPHFYYNTLASIIVLAENGQSDDVISLCRNLSKIMRYITDSSASIVSLKDEIEYVKKYLYCMQVRYQDSLTYEIDIDEDILSEKIPKLLIQPVVENALKYGTDCLPPWHLTIHGHKYDNCWKIDIIDSGKGFSQEALEQIEKRKKKVDENSGMPDLKIDGLGIANVYSRWKLLAKEQTIFEIGNTPQGHGIVTVGLYKI